jgi:hypothetical protein
MRGKEEGPAEMHSRGSALMVVNVLLKIEEAGS